MFRTVRISKVLPEGSEGCLRRRCSKPLVGQKVGGIAVFLVILEEFWATDDGQGFAKESLGEIRKNLFVQEQQAKSLLAIRTEIDKLRKIFEALDAHTSRLGGHQARSVRVGENIHADAGPLLADGGDAIQPLAVEDVFPRYLYDKAIAEASEEQLKRYKIVKGERSTYRVRPYPY